MLISNENYALPVFLLRHAESHSGSLSRKVLGPGSRAHVSWQNFISAVSRRAWQSQSGSSGVKSPLSSISSWHFASIASQSKSGFGPGFRQRPGTLLGAGVAVVG